MSQRPQRKFAPEDQTPSAPLNARGAGRGPCTWNAELPASASQLYALHPLHPAQTKRAAGFWPAHRPPPPGCGFPGPRPPTARALQTRRERLLRHRRMAIPVLARPRLWWCVSRDRHQTARWGQAPHGLGCLGAPCSLSAARSCLLSGCFTFPAAILNSTMCVCSLHFRLGGVTPAVPERSCQGVRSAGSEVRRDEGDVLLPTLLQNNCLTRRAMLSCFEKI